MNNGKICVSVAAETADEICKQIRRAEEFADVIEVRFDSLAPSEIRKAVENLPDSRAVYLFTFRPKEFGGCRDISLRERLQFWQTIFVHHKTDFMIDIEGEPEMMMAIEPNKIRRILSLHSFTGVWREPEVLFDVLSNQGDIAKLAASPIDIVDGLCIWKLLDRAKAATKQVIPIVMGESGKWTRILGLAHGAFMTYASLDADGETAPGQIAVRDLVEIYRVKELDNKTKVYGVIGDPVSESLSPFIHNPAFASAGINAVFVPFQVENLDKFMRRMVMPQTREAELNFAGFAVTMPHKQAIMGYLDQIDETAKKIGAVNTVMIEDGKLKGYNTDSHGFIMPLKSEYGDLKDARVAILGAGGAARACVYALKENQANITVFAREPNKAKVLADDFDVKYAEISNFRFQISNKFGDNFDILINATPLGMTGPLENESLFTAEDLNGVKFVYDLVTVSVDTPLIRVAKKANIPAIGGLEMLAAQGAKQFEIWTGKSAPFEQMKESAVERIGKMQN